MVTTAHGYGTTGVSGQRVLGLADWHRDGTLAEYVATGARDLAQEFIDLDNDALEDIGGVDLVLDVIAEIHKRSANLIRAGGTLVTVVGPPRRGPSTAWHSTSSSSPTAPK